MDLHRFFSPTNIALVSVFAGLIAASTIWPGVELMAGVPITLQTLAVLLCGAVLGPWRGAAAVLVYLAVGTAGAPIFAQHKGGLSAWTGVTAGFLIGFVFAAFVTGLMVRSLHRRRVMSLSGIVGACAAGSLIVLNVIGYTYLGVKIHASLGDTLAIAVPFLPGDIIKVFIASAVAFAIYRAYPWLLNDAEPEAEGTDATLAKATA